jgi:hypothetical protein
MIVTKPIVHMTVDRPMSVDLTVKITAGRPWFGYPMPDDFSVSGVPFRFGFVKRSKIDRSARDVPDELSIQDLTQIRSGYPWLGPSHPKEYMSAVTNVGFRWQSLIVLPERADWMKLEPVSKPKYQWWNRLREVQSSWICNRGESERFLYYDGPTESRSPVRVLDERIRIEIQAPPNNLEQACEREILYIEVRDEAVSAACKTMDVSAQSTSFTFLDTSNRPISGEDVASKLTKILVAKGLNHEEADGLVDCWRPQFFETGGRRLLTIFGTEEYGQLCPLSVSPKPTELARVGIVLTELKPKRENVKEIGREHKKRAEKNLRSESQLVH